MIRNLLRNWVDRWWPIDYVTHESYQDRPR